MKQKNNYTDIEGREIEIGDVVLRPMWGTLNKHIVLGFTPSTIKLSCFRHAHSSMGYFKNFTQHNSMQYLRWIPDLFIYKKNVEIPENLRKFIK